MKVHDRTMSMPLSHALPLSLALYPFYDKLPCRLSDFIYQKYGNLKLIDVGANIGDTVAAFYRRNDDKFLAIEPNPHFISYLRKNFADDSNVEIISCMCSSGESQDLYRIHELSGTSSLQKAEKGTQISSKTIDDLLNENSAFLDFNVMKIDTDGYDLEVIAGSINSLNKNLPAILFECECFDNGDSNYYDDCINTLYLLKDVGYDSFLLYDRFGYLMGYHSLNDLSHFKQILMYQLSSNILINTDILVMKKEDVESFYAEEKSVFYKNTNLSE